MGLEATTYIGGLTSAWPVSNDNKSVGDDHIRLIKATLLATFPTATKPFYFPTAEAVSGIITLDATDQNNTLIVDTSGGNITVNLPNALAVADKGWKCQVLKNTNDANAAIVTPAAGTIGSKCGAVNTIRVGILNEPATFFWTGSAWLCWKYGPMIGSTENFDGSVVPPGYLAPDGTTYSNTAFAELFAILATTTLRDKRGRTEIGDGTGSGLTARVNGTIYGNETKTLAAGDIPSLASSGNNSISVVSNIATIPTNCAVGNISVPSGPDVAIRVPGRTDNVDVTRGAVTSVNAAQAIAVNYTNASPAAIGLLQPSIGVKKIIRAC